mmetsp:Transcript_13646/g.51045  ORF Transcript_13646/g.51045 Transcript_13646/m.51045 type:complete len:200 (+) Transcript_13646:3879-4478(+)
MTFTRVSHVSSPRAKLCASVSANTPHRRYTKKSIAEGEELCAILVFSVTAVLILSLTAVLTRTELATVVLMALVLLLLLMPLVALHAISRASSTPTRIGKNNLGEDFPEFFVVSSRKRSSATVTALLDGAQTKVRCVFRFSFFVKASLEASVESPLNPPMNVFNNAPMNLVLPVPGGPWTMCNFREELPKVFFAPFSSS